jgi:poly-gamma-glutamate synthesis protein (capsule biosynthesis protein)
MSGNRIINKYLLALFVIVLAGSGLWYAAQLPQSHSFISPLAIFKPDPPQLTIVVVGDIMLDRNVRNTIEQGSFDDFFKGVKSFISGADIAVGNLEGPITTFPSKTADLKNKELTFTFDPKSAPELAGLGFDILGLANNHTMNFGKEGFAMTKKYIFDADMYSYGDPNNKDGISVIMKKKDITIGIVGFHEFTYVNFDKVLAEIDRLRPIVDFLIVTPHWGVEYQKEATDFQTRWAHTFIDHGADVVIGSHPHVVGDVEEYNGKKIFYSLGNFAFDQYFSKETSEGLAVKIALEKESNKITSNYTLSNVTIDRSGIKVSE